MSISINKIISKEKELFLAICLLAGEISADVIRMMKKKWGKAKVKNGIIQTLNSYGYIKKINRNKGYGGYGYQLTPRGLDYMKIKFPGKYDYESYSNSTAYTYKDSVRYRNLTISSILFYLWESGVALTNHMETASKILNFEEVSVEEPFFITTKQMKRLSIRFRPVYGYRIYGWIFTKDAVWGVYYPDSHHPIHMTREKAVYTSTRTVLQYCNPPYNKPQNYRFLFLFKDEDDYVASFKGCNSIYEKSRLTAEFYYEFHLKRICACIMTESNNLQSILDDDYYNRIDNVFRGSFELKHAQITSSFHNYRYICEDDRTAICWDLNPATIIETIEICHDSRYYNDYLLILCFDESRELLEQLLKRLHIDRQVEVSYLPRQDVLNYLSRKNNEL